MSSMLSCLLKHWIVKFGLRPNTLKQREEGEFSVKQSRMGVCLQLMFMKMHHMAK